MTYVYCDLSQRRREFIIQPESNDEFRVLCSNDYPVTDKLFGDDLRKKVEDITKANKVGSKISGSSNRPEKRSFPSRKYQGQKPYNQTNRPQPFLGQRSFQGYNVPKQQADEEINQEVLPSENESEFLNTSKNFTAGKIAGHYENWEMISSDSKILELVKGYSIEFQNTPFQRSNPKPINFNETDLEIIDIEIKEFQSKKIIEEVVDYNKNEFIPNIFVRPKKNGKFRVILNLKHLNDFVECHHVVRNQLSVKELLFCVD